MRRGKAEPIGIVSSEVKGLVADVPVLKFGFPIVGSAPEDVVACQYRVGFFVDCRWRIDWGSRNQICRETARRVPGLPVRVRQFCV